MEIISSNEEDISAVPKPDVRFEEAIPDVDNDDLKEFKSAVKDCTSAVSFFDFLLLSVGAITALYIMLTTRKNSCTFCYDSFAKGACNSQETQGYSRPAL